MPGAIRGLLPVVFAAMMVASEPCAAQRDTVPDAPAPRRGGVVLVRGVRVGWPQKASGYVGVGLPEKRFESGYTGWAITVEPGLGGGAVAIGRSTSGGFAMTWRLQASVLRTWGDPWLVGPDQTYVGVEALSIVFIGLGVGGYVRIPKEGEDPGVLFAASILIGN